MASPPDQLGGLSDEIFSCIHQIIGGDLSTHVALSQTCRRLRELYSKDDRIWQLACFSAGFGRPKKRGNPSEPLLWREIALILAIHTRRCQIYSCINANECFAEHYRHSPRTTVRSPHPSPPEVILHPLYFYLHFNHLPSEDAAAFVPYPDTSLILLTHLPTFPESKSMQYGPLCSHPNASCAFATFPPMESLNFEDAEGQTFLTVHNPDGVTILDVNRALADLIPRDSTPLDIALSHYRDLVRTSGLTYSQFADLVSKQRGFLGDHEYPFLQELVAQA
ncbi:hypothetical protein K474DRAFT_1660920 [Panus rudis PR-1116 ss-1]|nr:hypothetical protein K474DRAFT_1660920 [Panus rudis PR-1116 ss-1]